MYADFAQRFITEARQLVAEAGIKAPPVDPAWLARLRGIERIVLSNTLNASGQLIRGPEGLVIRLNAAEPRERRNFSCCHEIAHTFALNDSSGKLRTSLSTQCSQSSPEEVLCDRAAAEMLMPESLFVSMAGKPDYTIDALVGVAKRFGASITATILRLAGLALWPVVFIVWTFHARPGSVPKLRVSWSAKPDGARCFVPRHATADRESGMFATFVTSYPTVDMETLNLGSLRGKYVVENARFGEYLLSIVHNPNLQRRS